MIRLRIAAAALATAVLFALSVTTFSHQGARAAARDDRLGAAEFHHLAAERARSSGKAPVADLPPELAQLDYDGYRRLRARPEARLWHDTPLPFRVEPIHLGGRYRTPVSLAVLHQQPRDEEPEDGAPTLVPFSYSADQFDLPDGVPGLAPGAGFAGMRLFAPQRQPDEHTEFLVFHGASYFRGVGRDHAFGSSARALAIATAEPSGEEFPAFTRFVLEEPAPGDAGIVLHGLLESESMAGVLTARATPGEETSMDIEVTVYPRRDLDTVGIAPLTSMYLFSEGFGRTFDDFRAAVHDADGLQMITGTGERLWRPLSNGRTLQISAFADENPRGFGLTQRRRGFERFGDNEARYDLRPSVWIEPIGEPWGKGSIMLVEIPTETEFNDNIVAFWRPTTPLRKGEPASFRYRLRWCTSPPDAPKLARVIATRTGRAPDDGSRLFTVDFAGEGLRGIEGLRVDAAASVSGSIQFAKADLLPIASDGRPVVRVTLKFAPEEDADVAELTVRLLSGEDGENGQAVASERWMHRWTR